MENGFGTASLGVDERGSAWVRVVGSEFDPIYKSFTIESSGYASTTEAPNFDAPSSAPAGTTINVKLYQGDTPLSYRTISITKPDGSKTYDTTDRYGKVSVRLDQVGPWKFSVTVGEKTAECEVKATTEPLSVNVLTTEPLGNHIWTRD